MPAIYHHRAVTGALARAMDNKINIAVSDEDDGAAATHVPVALKTGSRW